MRRLIVRWLGHHLDERVRREIRNTQAMVEQAKRLYKANGYWREQYRSMRRDRDRLLVELTEARVKLANLRAGREVSPG